MTIFVFANVIFWLAADLGVASITNFDIFENVFLFFSNRHLETKTNYYFLDKFNKSEKKFLAN